MPPIWAEPPCLGHCMENPPGQGSPNFSYYSQIDLNTYLLGRFYIRTRLNTPKLSKL